MAEDAVAETMRKAWLAFERFDPIRAKPITWFASILQKVVYDEERRNKPLLAIEDVIFAPDVDEDEVFGERLSDRVYGAIMELSDSKRRLVLMHYVEGVPQTEIAKELGRTPQGVSVNMGQARNELRALLLR